MGEQQSPHLATAQGDANVALIKDGAVAFEGCLHTAIVERINYDQNNPLGFVEQSHHADSTIAREWFPSPDYLA